MKHGEAEKEAYVLGVFRGLDKRQSVAKTMRTFGLATCMFYDWVRERPEWELRLARTREYQAHELVAEALEAAHDEELDPKARRVIVDTNLKVAALYFPQRYSQAALDRLVAPELELDHVSPEEIATRIMRAIEINARLALPAPADVEDADFVDA